MSNNVMQQKSSTGTTGSSSFIVITIQGQIIRKKKKSNDWIIITIRTSRDDNSDDDDDDEHQQEHQQQECHPQENIKMMDQAFGKCYNVQIHRSMIIENKSDGEKDDKTTTSTDGLSTNILDSRHQSQQQNKDDRNLPNRFCTMTLSAQQHEQPLDSDIESPLLPITIPSCCLFLYSIIKVTGMIQEKTMETAIDLTASEMHSTQPDNVKYSSSQQKLQCDDFERNNQCYNESVKTNQFNWKNYNEMTYEEKGTYQNQILTIIPTSIELIQCAPDPHSVRAILQQIFPDPDDDDDENLSFKPQQQQKQQKQQHQPMANGICNVIDNNNDSNCSNKKDDNHPAISDQQMSNTTNIEQLRRQQEPSVEVNYETITIDSDASKWLRTLFPKTSPLYYEIIHPSNTMKPTNDNCVNYNDTTITTKRFYEYVLRNIICCKKIRQKRLYIAKIVRGLQQQPQPTNYQQQTRMDRAIQPIIQQGRDGRARKRLPRTKPKDIEHLQSIENCLKMVIPSIVTIHLQEQQMKESRQQHSKRTSCANDICIVANPLHKHHDTNESIKLGDDESRKILLSSSGPDTADEEKVHIDKVPIDENDMDRDDCKFISNPSLQSILNIPERRGKNNMTDIDNNYSDDEVDDNDEHYDDNEPIMSTRGTLSRRDYLVAKKHPQIAWIIRKIRSVVTSMASSVSSDGTASTPQSTATSPYHIVDVGGGRGDLAIAMSIEFPECHITIIDCNDKSLEAAITYARKLRCNLNRLHFICADFYNYVTATNEQRNKFYLEAGQKVGNNHNRGTNDDAVTNASIPPVDMVVALHACGDLSDLAVHYAQNVAQCPFVICPCCYTKQYIAHNSSNKSFEAPWRKRIQSLGVVDSLETANNDELDNHEVAHASDNGNDEDKNSSQELLSRLAELNEVPEISKRAMTVINATRLYCVAISDEPNGNTVMNSFSNREANTLSPESISASDMKPSQHRNLRFRVSLEEYESSLSRRNQVLVGIPLRD